jgi:PAS domain S-box-containing protein
LATLKPQPSHNKQRARKSFLEDAGHSDIPANSQDIKGRIDTFFTNFAKAKPFPAWIINKECSLLYANNAFYHDFSIDKESSDKNLNNIIPESWGNLLFQKHMQVLETGAMQTLQQKIIRANNFEEIFLVNLFLFTDEAGDKLISGEAIKITEQYQNISHLQKVNGSLTELSPHFSTANWEWNMVTNHIYRNDVMQELTGFTTHFSKNLGWWFSRIHPEDCKKVRESIKNILETQGHNWVCEYRFKHKTGTYIIVRDRGFVIYEDGQPVRMVGSFKDITQIKQQELIDLDEKINEQKIIAESFLAIQEKEKDRISYELNENINQILAAAKMFIECIVPANSDGEKNKDMAFEYISMGIKEIKKLYKEILTKQPFTEEGLANNITMLVESLESGSPIKVLCHFKEDIEILSPTKKSTIFRIVQEQFKNISQHSKAKNVTLTIELVKETIQVVIKDDGVGFSMEQIKWGVGFSCIHQQTKFYNGSVSIKTAAGKGCKMIIKIPLLN